MTESCRIPGKPEINIDDDNLKRILRESRTIAIVGLSDNPLRDSNIVARFLMRKGYRIIPVNPHHKEILGLPSSPDLVSVREPVDIVDIFRKQDDVPGVVDESLKIKPGAIWLQLGLVHNLSSVRAKSLGIDFIQSKCIKLEYSRLFDQGLFNRLMRWIITCINRKK